MDATASARASRRRCRSSPSARCTGPAASSTTTRATCRRARRRPARTGCWPKARRRGLRRPDVRADRQHRRRRRRRSVVRTLPETGRRRRPRGRCRFPATPGCTLPTAGLPGWRRAAGSRSSSRARRPVRWSSKASIYWNAGRTPLRRRRQLAGDAHPVEPRIPLCAQRCCRAGPGRRVGAVHGAAAAQTGPRQRLRPTARWSTTPASSRSLSPYGRFVAFARSPRTWCRATPTASLDVFLRDRDTDADGVFDEAGAVSTVSRQPAAARSRATAPAAIPRSRADGRYVVFESDGVEPLRDRSAAAGRSQDPPLGSADRRHRARQPDRRPASR